MTDGTFTGPGGAPAPAPAPATPPAIQQAPQIPQPVVQPAPQPIAQPPIQAVATEEKSKPFWQSKGVIGGAIAAVASVLALVGVDLSEMDKNAMSDLAVSLAGSIGGIVAIVGRLTAKKSIN